MRIGDAEDEGTEDSVIRLVTGYWRVDDPVRRAELDRCLKANGENQHIASIDLVCESSGNPGIEAPHDYERFPEKFYVWDSSMLVGPRCHLSGRETYRQLFDLENRACGWERVPPPGYGYSKTTAGWMNVAERDLVIVANADIVFDETVALLEECVDADTLACISRTERNGMPPFWDVTHPENFGNPKKHWPDNSQDAWAFRAPIRDFSCDWAMGVLGCDNRLATEAKAAGMRLVNPFPAVKAWHVHEAKRPVVRKRPCVGGPFTDVPPTAGLFERAAARA